MTKDLTGQTFGAWQVLHEASRSQANQRMMFCRCECGIERAVHRHRLVAGRSTSCGCRTLLSLTGMVFGKRTVLGRAKEPRMWRYRCECGTIGTARYQELKNHLSCGCHRATFLSKLKTKHGLSFSKPHMIWTSMRQRCNNPAQARYADYGGRGIKVCEQWNDFVVFWKDMGPTYRDGLSIERVNNDGDYEPGNCVWIPKGQQVRNRRSPRRRRVEGPDGPVTRSPAD